MTDLESAKARFADAFENLPRELHDQSRPGLLDDWIELLSKTGIWTFSFSFNPCELPNYYAPDEVVFSKTFHFYDSDYLLECCSPGPDCLAGEHSIPIGGVDGTDEFVYLSANLRRDIAILHRDDAWAASNLDAVVRENAAWLHLSLPRFVQLLVPETNLVKLGAVRDGRYWVVVEDLGSKVRFEVNLPGHGDSGERWFDGPTESEEFLFELIRRARAVMNLTVLACPAHLRPRVEATLKSP